MERAECAELEAAVEISALVGSGLDRASLVQVLELLRCGVSPDSIADCEWHLCVSQCLFTIAFAVVIKAVRASKLEQ
jgi:hypothetical protein